MSNVIEFPIIRVGKTESQIEQVHTAFLKWLKEREAEELVEGFNAKFQRWSEDFNRKEKG